jgi:hypothetical protein
VKQRRNPHATIDAINAHQDRIIASRIRRNPELIELARQNLRRWMRKDCSSPRPIFCEWQQILDRLTPTEIARFLLSDTPMARRLQQSSPFAGILTDTELAGIRHQHEEN